MTQLGTLIGDITFYINLISTPKTTLNTSYGFVTLNITPNNSFNSATAITFTGTTIKFDTQGNSDAQFFISVFISAGTAITFNNVIMDLFGDAVPAKASNIFWLTDTGITSTGSSPMYGTFISQNATIAFASALTVNGNIFVSENSSFPTPTGKVTFSGVSTVNANTGPVVCYLKGTNILTENGYVAIEDLNAGDLVYTKGKIYNNDFIVLDQDYELKPIKFIGDFFPPNINTDSLHICFKANAFGESLPCEDLYVSPGHRILFDGEMVVAKEFINGSTIYQDMDRRSVHYYHIELDSHYAITANGLLSETYLDFETRGAFQNIKQIENEQLLQESILA